MKAVDKNGGPVTLKAWRSHRKMSQAALAEAVGTNANMIGYLESGERALTVLWMRKLGAALKAKPGSLIDDLPDRPSVAESVDSPRVINVERLTLAIAAALQTNPPPGGWTAEDAESIAEVSARVAALDPSDPANPTNPREIEMVVRGAIGLRREDVRPA